MAGGKRTRWMALVKKTMKSRKGMSLKQAMKIAKKSYKKTRGGAALSPADYSGVGTAAPAGGRRRKTRKGGRKH